MDAFTGEIRLFPFNFAPEGWALCDGKLLLVREYPALYSVIGITYGGNAGTNFNLPNLNGRAALGAGQGTSLTQRVLGQAVGADRTTLLPENFAPHSHQVLAKETFDAVTALDVPNANALLAQPRGIRLYNSNMSTGVATLHPNTVTVTGTPAAAGGSTRNNMQPFLTLRYCICLNGEYPQKP
ncbi:phage tail protein [Pseudomonas protegens]|uniref:phage tail protein n=1 Tax=Pseudomonas protegens TaxID=380021 RepID=UPI0032ED802B